MISYEIAVKHLRGLVGAQAQIEDDGVIWNIDTLISSLSACMDDRVYPLIVLRSGVKLHNKFIYNVVYCEVI